MTDSFLAAAAVRAKDQLWPALSSEYAKLAERMPPTVRRLIVNNADPSHVDAQRVLNELELEGWYADEEDESALEQIPGMLSSAQCAAVRGALEDAAASDVDGGEGWFAADSVDQALDFQLSITKDGLIALVGAEAVALLLANADRCRASMAPGAHLPGTGSAGLSEPHEIFIRRYTPATRPWFGFHVDRSQLTMNIALSDDAAHGGGNLLAIYDGLVQRVERGEGSATVHPSGVQHAVTRMYSGMRYSLILFFGRKCPFSEHPMVLCDSDCMRRLYAEYGELYHCDRCKRTCQQLGWPSMLHCAALSFRSGTGKGVCRGA